MDEESVRRSWRERGFSFGVWTDPPGQVWADFVHDTDELVMLVEGEIEIRMGGRVFRPRVGEEVLIPAGTSHTVVNVGKTRNRWLYGYRTSAR
ncbi:MAG: hypothetical protein KatS3mg076_1849 [Candidatus Binatia bacterium]|nr:MAG: hypothetical protein KatS3mg076_1849 [Candidatus Binatia bacterium]